MARQQRQSRRGKKLIVSGSSYYWSGRKTKPKPKRAISQQWRLFKAFLTGRSLHWLDSLWIFHEWAEEREFRPREESLRPLLTRARDLIRDLGFAGVNIDGPGSSGHLVLMVDVGHSLCTNIGAAVQLAEDARALFQEGNLGGWDLIRQAHDDEQWLDATSLALAVACAPGLPANTEGYKNVIQRAQEILTKHQKKLRNALAKVEELVDRTSDEELGPVWEVVRTWGSELEAIEAALGNLWTPIGPESGTSEQEVAEFVELARQYMRCQEALMEESNRVSVAQPPAENGRDEALRRLCACALVATAVDRVINGLEGLGHRGITAKDVRDNVPDGIFTMLVEEGASLDAPSLLTGSLCHHIYWAAVRALTTRKSDVAKGGTAVVVAGRVKKLIASARAVDARGTESAQTTRSVADGTAEAQEDLRRLAEQGAQGGPYSSRLESFISEYLGTVEHPVPFGGRRADIEGLNAWLDEPEAPPYLLLSSPAGRGKSALLVRWTQRLRGRQDIAVIFFPVSVRFRTNLAEVFFVHLAALLAGLHGEEVPGSSASREELREMIATSLKRPLEDGRRLLLVLDGLDEGQGLSLGPDFFPARPPDQLRIVVSARLLGGDSGPGTWLRRLGWNPNLARCSDLQPLSREGVADVLGSIGFPLEEHPRAGAVVRELCRLSEGDPLVLRLHLDDVRSQGKPVAELQPEDFHGIRPRLEGYFDHWWQDQERLWGDEAPMQRRSVQMVFDLLSCALGPLTREDILDLMPKRARFNSHVLREAIKPLGRFVVGDGKEQGYVFSHPRLGEWFRRRLSEAELYKWESRFLTYGKKALRDTNTIGGHACTISPYLVSHLGAHLVASGCVLEDLLPLVTKGWMEAWLHLEGGYSGFLKDVCTAWRVAGRMNRVAVLYRQRPRFVSDEIRCMLVSSSVRSHAGSLPVGVLAGLLQGGIWTAARGLRHVRLRPEVGERAEALCAVVPFLEKERLGDALDIAKGLEQPSLCAQVFARISLCAGEVVDVTYFHDLRTMARLCPDLSSRGVALAALAGLAARFRLEESQGLLAEVWDAMGRVKDLGDRARVAAELATVCPRPWGRKAVANVLRVARSRMKRDEMWYVVVPLLATPVGTLGRPTVRLLFKALRESVALVCHRRTLRELAPHVPESEVPLLLSSVERYMSPVMRAAARAHLLRHSPETTRTQQAQSICRFCASGRGMGDVRAEALAAAASFLEMPAKRQMLLKAQQVAEEVDDLPLRMRAIAALADYIKGRPKQDTLSKALAIAKEVQDESRRVMAISFLIAQMDWPEQEEAVGSVLLAVKHMEPFDIPDILRRLGPALGLDDLMEAIRIACSLGAELAVKGVTPLVQYLPRKLRLNTISEVMQIAESSSEDWRAEALCSILPNLVGPPRERALGSVMALLSELMEPVRTLTLLRVVPFLPETSGRELIKEALDRAVAWPDSWLPEFIEIIVSRLRDDEIEKVHARIEYCTDGHVWGECIRLLGPRLSKGAWVRAWRYTTKEIADHEARALALSGLVKSKAMHDNLTYVLLWQPMFRSLGFTRREVALQVLADVAPLLADLVGNSGLQKIAFSIVDVGEWVP